MTVCGTFRIRLRMYMYAVCILAHGLEFFAWGGSLWLVLYSVYGLGFLLVHGYLPVSGDIWPGFSLVPLYGHWACCI